MSVLLAKFSDGLVCWFRQSLSLLVSIDVHKEALYNWSQLSHKCWGGKGPIWPLSLISNVVWGLMTLTTTWLWINSSSSSKSEGKAVLKNVYRSSKCFSCPACIHKFCLQLKMLQLKIWNYSLGWIVKFLVSTDIIF